MPRNSPEGEVVDDRLTIEVDDIRGRQKKDGYQFKVTCNICNKQMMRASVVRHARNVHYLHGTWKEVSKRVEDVEEAMEDNSRSFTLAPAQNRDTEEGNIISPEVT